MPDCIECATQMADRFGIGAATQRLGGGALVVPDRASWHVAAFEMLCKHCRNLIGPMTPGGFEPTADTRGATVRTGATVCARATIGCGVEIGAYAMVGMGAVVTRDVPAYGLAYGVPARVHGYVCLCGVPVLRCSGGVAPPEDVTCAQCGRAYGLRRTADGPRFGPRD